PRFKSGALPQRSPVPFQLQFAQAMQTLEALQKRLAETLAQCVRIDQVLAVAMAELRTTTDHPTTFSVQRWPATRNQRMHVGMRFQFLVPGMQHHRGRGFKS